MSEVVSLAARRWDGDTSPERHSAREVLEVVLAKIDAGEIGPDHIIICHARNGIGTPCGFYQAGNFSAFEQLGLLTHVQHMMERGE